MKFSNTKTNDAKVPQRKHLRGGEVGFYNLAAPPDANSTVLKHN